MSIFLLDFLWEGSEVSFSTVTLTSATDKRHHIIETPRLAPFNYLAQAVNVPRFEELVRFLSVNVFLARHSKKKERKRSAPRAQATSHPFVSKPADFR